MASVLKGTWPAAWLTGAKSWPPEIDLAEWKGNGKVRYLLSRSSAVSV